MTFPSLLPEILRRSPGRVELSLSRTTRALYVALGAALVMVLLRDPAGTPFAVMFGIVIALAAFSEDRWIFDGTSGEIRKRYGILFLVKSWAIDLDMVSSIELDADFTGAEQSDPYAKVAGGFGKDHCALKLVLSDGRTMVLCSAKRKHLAELRARGAAIAETTGRPLVED